MLYLFDRGENGRQAHAVCAMGVGQVAGRIDLVRLQLLPTTPTVISTSSSLSGFFLTLPVS